MKKILILFAALFISLSAMANGVEIGGIHYLLDEETHTASVTYTGDSPGYNDYTDDIIIPDTISYNEVKYLVNSIGEEAFCCSNMLISITISKSIISIGEEAFRGCPGLSYIEVNQDNEIYDSRGGCNAIIETVTNTLIAGCANTVIPNNVTSIARGAFWGCSSPMSITIPNSVVSIGELAFADCTSLRSISISGNVSQIENSTFSFCSYLSSVTILSGVLSIGDYAFSACSSLRSITIPETIISIGDGAFSDCSALNSVYIVDLAAWCEISFYKNSFTTPFNLYQNGEFITNLRIPDSVTSIADYAFDDVLGIATIYIPSGVSYVGIDVFTGSGLSYITCMALDPPLLASNFIDVLPGAVSAYVPASAVEDYKQDWGWLMFDVQPLVVHVTPITKETTELYWAPVDSASQYQLRLYTDLTSSIVLDTTLLINADSLNGGIMVQSGTSVARRVKKIIQDAGGTIIVITIDPSSGSSAENPYKVTVSAVCGEMVEVQFEMKVYRGNDILKEDFGWFVLNDEAFVPTDAPNFSSPSLPTGIYDLYGHRYPAEAWESLPAGVYVRRTEDRVEKVMKK